MISLDARPLKIMIYHKLLFMLYLYLHGALTPPNPQSPLARILPFTAVNSIAPGSRIIVPTAVRCRRVERNRLPIANLKCLLASRVRQNPELISST
jgi:hypothetical protein